jgi:hypothetical protein
MKLKRWLKLVGMKQTELSAIVSCPISSISRHIRHGRVLTPEVVVRIYFLTQGEVRPDDFYDLDTIPPDIKKLLKAAKAARHRLSLRQGFSASDTESQVEAPHE